MDRNEVLIIIQKINFGQLKTEDVIRIITEYCIEKGKDSLIIQQFISFLLSIGEIMGPFSIALEYFQKKFNICTITNEKGKVLITF